MNITNWRPPWYAYLNKKLEGAEWLINVGLVLIVVLTVLMLARGDRLSRATWLIYLLSP